MISANQQLTKMTLINQTKTNQHTYEPTYHTKKCLHTYYLIYIKDV